MKSFDPDKIFFITSSHLDHPEMYCKQTVYNSVAQYCLFSHQARVLLKTLVLAEVNTTVLMCHCWMACGIQSS